MTIELSEQVEQYIKAQVKAGNFPSADAVVEAALLQSMAEEVELTDEDRQAIAEADAQIERGEWVTLEEARRQLHERIRGI